MDDIEKDRKRRKPFAVMRQGRSIELRQLKSYPLSPPHFPIETDILINSYVEYEVKYAGVIHGIQVDVDVTNRTDVLRIIDRGKKNGNIQQGFEAIISLCKNNIKFLRRHGEEMLLRVPIHEIAAICYIKDDHTHILSVKHGNPDHCDLTVLYCDSKLLAEGICALLEKCFQLVYTEATLQLLEDVIRNPDGRSISSSTDSPTITQPDRVPFLRVQEKPSGTPSVASDISTQSTQAKLIQEYMVQLPSHFNIEELTQFASLLRALNDPSPQMPFPEFCDRVYKLYGADRKQLLVGLCPFIHEKNYKYFCDFLKKNGINEPENGTLSSRNSYPRMYTRSISDISGNESEFESILDEISSQFERIDASMEHSRSNGFYPHGFSSSDPWKYY